LYEIHKKAAGQSAPAAFDSYPALFRKKKEILHKMKRLKTIASLSFFALLYGFPFNPSAFIPLTIPCRFYKKSYN